MRIIYTKKEAEKVLSDLKQCDVKIEDDFIKGGAGGGAYNPFDCISNTTMYQTDCSTIKQ